MLDTIQKTIREYAMLQKGDAVLVAVSGGIDSVVLLHALAQLSREYRLSLIAVHVNHCLRGKESDRDELFVKRFAKRLKIPFVSKKVNVRGLLKKGDSLQEIARKARYAFFERCAQTYKADRIATGHNLDDQAETLIMRFLRGAGSHGLSGIPAVRGKYIRPLIHIARKDIEEYAAKSSLAFVSDSSNKRVDYLRNRIRQKLVPLLEKYNPNVKRDMAELGRVMERDEAYLRDKAKHAYQKIVESRKRGAISFSLKGLDRLHDAVKIRVFFIAIEELLDSSMGFYSCHVEDFLDLLKKKAPNVSIDLPHDITVYKEYDRVTFEKNEKPRVRGQKKGSKKTGLIRLEQRLKVPSETRIKALNKIFKTSVMKSQIPNLKSKIPNIAYFDSDILKLPLIVRSFQPGDRFTPSGMKGHKKLKNLFIEKKIAKRVRSLVPILVSGKEIIWVAGLRQSEYGKVLPKTKRILKIEMSEVD